MTIHVDQESDFHAMELLRYLLLQCPNLVELGYDAERMEIPVDAVYLDCGEGLRFSIKGQWFKLCVAAVKSTCHFGGVDTLVEHQQDEITKLKARVEALVQARLHVLRERIQMRLEIRQLKTEREEIGELVGKMELLHARLRAIKAKVAVLKAERDDALGELAHPE